MQFIWIIFIVFLKTTLQYCLMIIPQVSGFSCCCLCPTAMDSLHCKTSGRITKKHCHNNQLDPLLLLQLHFSCQPQGYLLLGDWPLSHQCLKLPPQLNHPTYLIQKYHNNSTVSCYLPHNKFRDDQMWIKSRLLQCVVTHDNCLFSEQWHGKCFLTGSTPELHILVWGFQQQKITPLYIKDTFFLNIFTNV